MENQSTTTLYEDWDRIQALFPARKAIRPGNAMLNGVSTRLGAKRLTRMMTGTAQKALREIIHSASDQRVKALRVVADVNHEQTSTAFRLTMIANVTAPLAFLAVLHQSLPKGLSQVWSYIESEGQFFIWWNFGLAILLAVLIAFLITWALANLGQSRDIKNLIDIYAAERGIFFGLEDSETA